MNRKIQLPLVATGALLLTAAVSHFLVGWLGIRTGTVRYRVVGDLVGAKRGLMAGSSLLGDALDLQQVSKELGRPLETWFVAGSSPSEWEPFLHDAPRDDFSLIAVSAYDLNEDFLCDFRSQIVPLPAAIRDLSQARSSWTFSKRVLSQYPLRYVRFLFPTAGRSQGVMGGVKEKIRTAVGHWVQIESEVGPKAPTFAAGARDPEKETRISEWSSGNLLRRLVKLRSACLGRHSYNGLKRLALGRMLTETTRRGHVVLLVLPVSPAYEKEFLGPSVRQEFEGAIASLHSSFPGAQLVRLDQEDRLRSNELYWDVVHMNVEGQRAATDLFLQQLQHLPAAQ